MTFSFSSAEILLFLAELLELAVDRDLFELETVGTDWEGWDEDAELLRGNLSAMTCQALLLLCAA